MYKHTNSKNPESVLIFYFVLCWVAQLCLTISDPMDCGLLGSSVHGDSPGNNTGVGCYVILQGIFPTKGSNSGLLHWKLILYHLSHQGGPRTLQWVAYPFSRGSFQPRNRTSISCTTGYSKQILTSFYFINYLILGLNISYFLINFLVFLAYWKLKDRAKDFCFLKARHLGIFPKKVWIKWKKITY